MTKKTGALTHTVLTLLTSVLKFFLFIEFVFLQVFMSMMGNDKKGQLIVYYLIELLKSGSRLPQPLGCPTEVTTVPYVGVHITDGHWSWFGHCILIWEITFSLTCFLCLSQNKIGICFFQIHEIMEQCWDNDPYLRPSFKELALSIDLFREYKEF